MTALPTLVGKSYYNPASTASTTTMTVSPDNTIANGNWMIAVLALINPTTVNTVPSGWTQIQANTVSGSLSTAIYAKPFVTGETSYTWTVSANGNTSSILLFWGSGGDVISNWIIGATKLRSAITPTTSFNNVAPSVTTTAANSLALVISTERTSASETDISSISGATEWYFAAQNAAATQIQTTMIGYINKPTAGATGDVTVVYPNTQASNGQALQVIIPPTPDVPPGAAFSTTASNYTISFNGSASTVTSGATISSYAWNFGDSNTGTGATTSHTYATRGTYTVSLTITDSNGATNTLSKSVVVRGLPVTQWNGTSEVPVYMTIWNGSSEVAPPAVTQGSSPVKFSQLSSPILVAHRGGSNNWPEESIRAYKESADVWGMQAIEISVQVSSNGTFWCSHDATTTRTTGQNYTISSTTDAVLSTLTNLASTTDNTTQPAEPFAKLTDVLAIYGGKRVIFIEDKTYANQTALLNIMDSYGGPDYFVWKQFASSPVYAAAASRGYRSWGYLFSGDMAGSFANNQASFTYVGLDYNCTDAVLTSAIATAGGNRVIGHIISSTAQYTRMLGFGMAGLMVSNVRVCLPKIAS